MTILILSNTANINFYTLLENCIKTIDTNKYKVIVVETNAKLKNKQIPLNAEFIFPEIPFNYNEFLNIGLKYIKDTKIVIANNDIVFEPGCLSIIESKLDVYDSVCPQDIFTHTELIKEDIIGTTVGYHVIGCCIGVTLNTIQKIGDFDSTFKFWYQDNDYCNNLKKYNLKHALLSDAKIKHLKMQSHSLLGDKQYEMTHGLGKSLSEKWPEYS
jgi:hypothetical protein